MCVFESKFGILSKILRAIGTPTQDVSAPMGSTPSRKLASKHDISNDIKLRW